MPATKALWRTTPVVPGKSRFFIAATLGPTCCVAAAVTAQRRDAFIVTRDHAAIKYSAAPVSTAVTALNRALSGGSKTLAFDPKSGYLKAVLEALDVPVESQALVFSPTSFQAELINMHNPRAVFFNDTVSVGWVRGADVLEIAALDPRQGVIFYSLDQKSVAAPELKRTDQCLFCHLSWDTLGVPGLMVTSMYPLPDDKNAYANGFTTVHGSPLEQRWGGWWVTGSAGGARHMGNVPVMPADARRKLATPTRELPSVQGLFDLAGYPDPVQRRGGPARIGAPGENDEPDHPCRVGGPACDAGAKRGCIGPCPRSVRGFGGLSALRGRGALGGSGAGHVRVCRALRVRGPSG